MLKSQTFQKYFLPGFVFQSVVIGGGYGTGRELVEFFLTDGPAAGLIGIVDLNFPICDLVFITKLNNEVSEGGCVATGGTSNLLVGKGLDCLDLQNLQELKNKTAVQVPRQELARQ